jgi:hypothetical protein
VRSVLCESFWFTTCSTNFDALDMLNHSTIFCRNPLKVYSTTTKRDYDRDFRERNKEALQERAKLYKFENQDDIKIKQREYYNNLDKSARKLQLRDYYIKNQSTLKERARRLFRDGYLRNRDVVNLKARKRYLASKKNKVVYSPRSHARHKSWRSVALVRDYFDALAKELHISNYTDWYRISRAQIISAGGTFLSLIMKWFLSLGKGLYRKFENIGGALQYAYPEHNWDISKFSFRGKKSGQRWLRVKVSELLPGIDIIEDHQHPELYWGMSFIVVLFHWYFVYEKKILIALLNSIFGYPNFKLLSNIKVF